MARIIPTKVVGVTQNGRQEALLHLVPGELLFLRREPKNDFDPNAVMVMNRCDEQLGYLSRQLALELAPRIDSGSFVYDVRVQAVTGRDKKTLGCNIHIKESEKGGKS